MTSTGTHTHTRTMTLTLEEKSVLVAVETRREGWLGKWTLDDIWSTMHGNLGSPGLIDVGDHVACAVILGQLIERGLVRRADGEGRDQTYTRA